jgi:outer membrane protein TolC
MFRYALLLAGLLAGGEVRAGELGDLLRETLQHPQVKSVASQSEAAQAYQDAAAWRYLGTATLLTNYRHYESLHAVGSYAPGTSPLPPLSDRIGQVGVTYSLPVDIFATIHANYERARYDLVAAKLVERQQTLIKLHQTATAFLSLQAFLAQSEALAASRRRVEMTYRRIKQEVALGKAAGINARFAESELARIAADEAILAGAFTQAEADLTEASGRKHFRPQIADVIMPPWDIADMLLPVEIARARADSARSQADEAQRALLPAVSIDTSYAQNLAPSNVRRDTWFIGATLTLPLGVSQFKQAKAQELNAEAVSQLSDAANRDGERQIAGLQGTYTAAIAEVQALDKEVVYRQQVLEVAGQMQRLGSQTLEDLFTRERELLDARYRLAQARARAAISWSAAQIIGGLPIENYISRMDPK